MKILVSACLLGEKCRFDGCSKPCCDVIDFCSQHEVICVCPEVLGGFSIPHVPSEIVHGHQSMTLNDVKVCDLSGLDTTKAFCAGALATLSLARKSKCTHAILKAKSPSCGIGKIYSGDFSGTLVDGNGVAARLLIKEGFQVATELDFKEVFGIE